ncbi:unnamed protein product [Caenorhabditis angaria]|uniref:Protein CLP1 homolog n=1 Tax=Caenorhabditis angaria TaxID=860376 RepID=A0A9P1II29_9PELO|nr:unnamed protein product [Caenorhabditis angaria]
MVDNVQEFKLREDSELRFAVGDEEDVVLELIEGYAEMFGTEITPNKKYTFPPSSRVAIYTYTQATIELFGKVSSHYVADDTPMVFYVNIHAAIEEVRQAREEQAMQSGYGKPKGPKVLLVGPSDVGKSTLSRILCNYSVRQGRCPVFVDLDVGQNNISVPGTIGALIVDKTADIIDGFDRTNALVYNFGHTSPGGSIGLYKAMMKQLAASMKTPQFESNSDALIGGMIINTCGWVNDAGYECIKSAAESFEVDIVIVIDHERLYSDLSRDLPEFVRLLKCPKSGGVEKRDSEFRGKTRTANVHSYFYGTKSQQVFPFNIVLQFNDIKLFRIGTEKLPDSCLPFGMEEEDPDTRVVEMTPSTDILHHLFAISHSNIVEDICKSAVCGFVLVKEIDMEQQKMTVLSVRTTLPSTNLVFMNISHLDDHV